VAVVTRQQQKKRVLPRSSSPVCLSSLCPRDVTRQLPPLWIEEGSVKSTYCVVCLLTSYSIHYLICISYIEGRSENNNTYYGYDNVIRAR